MTRHEIEIRMSEIRESLNAETPPDNADALRVEYRELEGKFRDVVKAEQTAEAEERAAAEGATPEATEHRALLEKVELRSYLLAAGKGVPITQGAEHELGTELKLSNTAGVLVPWEVLEPRQEPAKATEHRVDAITEVPTTTTSERPAGSIVARIFGDTLASFLGVNFPTVPVGETQYVHFGTGVTGVQASPGDEVDGVAATFTPVTLAPIRLSARYVFRIEDAARLQGVESALRADLRSALAAAVDEQVIKGDGSAPNVGGFFAVAANGGLPVHGDDVTALVTAAIFRTLLAGRVDGKFASRVEDLRMLFGADTFGVLYALLLGQTPLLDRYAAQYRVSQNVPATDAMVQEAVAAKSGVGGVNSVAPVWQGIELIRDPYSGAKQGYVALTAIQLWNFQILRKDAYSRIGFKVAA